MHDVSEISDKGEIFNTGRPLGSINNELFRAQTEEPLTAIPQERKNIHSIDRPFLTGNRMFTKKDELNTS